MISRHLVLTALLAVLIPNGSSAQGMTFHDDFESGLARWTGRNFGSHTGIIVTDPLDPANHVLTFSQRAEYGDIFSDEFPVQEGNLVHLRFDYLGFRDDTGIPPHNSGGFLGYAEDVVPTRGRWLVATDAISQADPILVDDSTWHHYSMTFNPHEFFTPAHEVIRLILEDHLNPPRNAYFDNIEVRVDNGRRHAPLRVSGSSGTVGPAPSENSTWSRVKALFTAP